MKKTIFIVLLLAAPSFAQFHWFGWKRTLTTITPGTVDSTTIVDGGIGAADYRAGSVNAAAIGVDAVAAAEIAANAVGTSEIATNGVAADEIAADAVGESELAESMNFTPTGSWNFTGATFTKKDVLELFADAWTATGTNGAASGTLASYIPVYDFDATTAETLSVDWRVPGYFSSIDSIHLEVAVNSTAGDSISFKLEHRDVNTGEAYTGAFGDAKTFGPTDLGATANVMHRLRMTTALAGIAANDRVIFKLYRDASISDDVTADGRFVGLYLFGKGIK